MLAVLCGVKVGLPRGERWILSCIMFTEATLNQFQQKGNVCWWTVVVLLLQHATFLGCQDL